MTTLPAWYFERRARCADCWQRIDPEQLRTELDAEQIDSILIQRAVIRTATHVYRLGLPETVRDWAAS